MTREEARKLLGGYATGNLSPEQQQALFEAALEDQELFDALAAEQPLHDLLSDDAARRQLLGGIQPPAPKRRWWMMPGFALAATAAAVLAFIALKPHPAPVILADIKQPVTAVPSLTPPTVQPESPANPTPRVAERPRPRARAATPQRLADAAVPAVKEKADAPLPTVTAETPPVSAAPIPAAPPPQPNLAVVGGATSQSVEVTSAGKPADDAKVQNVRAPVTNGLFMSRNSAFALDSTSLALHFTVQLRQPDGTYTAVDPKALKAGNTARLTITPDFSGILTVTRNPGDIVLTKPTPVELHKPFNLDVTSETPDLRILKIELKRPGLPTAVQSVTLIFQ